VSCHGHGPVPTPLVRGFLRAVVTLVLSGTTALVGLAFVGQLPWPSREVEEDGAVFYVVPYLYGFAYYDRGFREIAAMEVREGETVTLYVVPAHALSREAALAYAERTLTRAIGGLPPGDPAIRRRILDDIELGNIEHIVGITAQPVYVPTAVTPLLRGQRFRPDGPPTVRAAVERRDPAIRRARFTAKRAGTFDVLCVDSGPDGAGTCGWGHKWMVGPGGFVVRPRTAAHLQTPAR
jgi:hypothetical protein